MIIERLKNFVGLADTDEYEEEYEEMDWQQYDDEDKETLPPIEPETSSRRQMDFNLKSDTSMETTTVRNNVIGMPGITNSSSEVVVVEPHSFEEMPQVIQTLKERKSVILNLNIMDPEEAQRAVDFVAGGTYAIDGHQERIGESIFLFTPSCVKVSSLSGNTYDTVDAPTSGTRSKTAIPTWGMDASRLAQ